MKNQEMLTNALSRMPVSFNRSTTIWLMTAVLLTCGSAKPAYLNTVPAPAATSPASAPKVSLFQAVESPPAS